MAIADKCADRMCLFCRKKLRPKYNSFGKKETPAEFKIRKYCDTKCKCRGVASDRFGRSR
jgi:hypothetical protein